MDKKNKFMFGAITLISGIASYTFTIIFLTSFASGTLSFILYLMAGVIIDGVKWLTLKSIITNAKLKEYGQIALYVPIFTMFALVSILASISFSVNTTTAQLYTTTYTQNQEYVTQSQIVATAEQEILNFEAERDNELARLNLELDTLPSNYTTRRTELEQQKTELKTKYDNQINNKRYNLNNAKTALAKLDSGEVRTQTLKDTDLAYFFGTIAKVLKVEVEEVVMAVAVTLGIILDTAALVCIYFGEFTNQSKRELRKQQTAIKHKQQYKQELKAIKKQPRNIPPDSSHDSTSDSDTEEALDLTFEEFQDAINEEPHLLDYAHWENIISKSTFYRWKKQLPS